MINFEDILENDFFLKKTILSGNASLDNMVSCVFSQDFSENISDNGLYVTDFPKLNDVKSLDLFFEKLKHSNVAGLLIKHNDNLMIYSNLVTNLKKFGKQFNLPIVVFSSNREIVDIMLIISNQINKKYLKANDLQAIYSRFTNLSLKNRGLDSILFYFKKLVKNPVAVYDENYQCVATTDEEFRDYLNDFAGIFKGSIKENLDSLFYYKQKIGPVNGELKYEHSQKIFFPITLENRVRGYLILFETEQILDPMDYSILEMAATFTLIEIKKYVERKTTGERFINDIIYDLISKKVDDYGIIHERANLIGLNLNDNYRVVLFTIDNTNKNLDSDVGFQNYQDKICSIIEKHIHKVKPNSILGRLSNFSIVLWPVSNVKNDEKEYLKIKNACRDIQKLIKNQFHNQDITVGIGELANNVEEISRSFKEAYEIIKLGSFFGKDMISGIKDLGIFKLLLSIENKEILLELIPSSIFELNEYDETHNTEFLKTLKIYLNYNYNAVNTAKHLFVHYKTILYRLNRINEIAGIDLEDYNKRLELEIGIKLLDLFETYKL